MHKKSIIFINDVFQKCICDYLIYLKIFNMLWVIINEGLEVDDCLFDNIGFLH